MAELNGFHSIDEYLSAAKNAGLNAEKMSYENGILVITKVKGSIPIASWHLFLSDESKELASGCINSHTESAISDSVRKALVYIYYKEERAAYADVRC